MAPNNPAISAIPGGDEEPEPGREPRQIKAAFLVIPSFLLLLRGG